MPNTDAAVIVARNFGDVRHGAFPTYPSPRLKTQFTPAGSKEQQKIFDDELELEDPQHGQLANVRTSPGFGI